ncbi:hypothetical protein KP509_16G002900 [Ceratopteris richardii]|uniref:CRC domain-containing protein n=1 Tax=Ceratopteris richardii TaxID=49495 RepID=A0A8T2SW97_CERRI|nr:hypothetical protein KP509_16G002900 [Ceratopteris richardii]
MNISMDSPDHKPLLPSSDCQGSPFFHFLCSLSPIKLASSGHGTQTFSELSFPPPPPVFVSPKAAENQKESARSRRKILIGDADAAEKATQKDGSACCSPKPMATVEKATFTWRDTKSPQHDYGVEKSQSLSPSERSSGLSAVRESGCQLLEQETETVQHASHMDVSFPTDPPCSTTWSKSCLLPCQTSQSAYILPSDVNLESSLLQTLLENPRICQEGVKDTVDETIQTHSLVEKRKDVSCVVSCDTSERRPVQLEGLSRILTALQGVLNKDIEHNFQSVLHHSLMKPSSFPQDSLPQSLDQASKASIGGVPRRCLDFKTPDIQLDDRTGYGGLDPSSHSHIRFPTSSVAAPSTTISGQSSIICSRAINSLVASKNISPSYVDTLHQYNSSDVTCLPLLQCMPHATASSALSSQGEPAHSVLHPVELDYSVHNTQLRRPGEVGDGVNLSSTSTSLPDNDFPDSASQNETTPTQCRGDQLQADYFKNLDQDLLIALVKRTAMNPSDLMVGSSAAYFGTTRPMSICAPIPGSDTVVLERNKFASELENEPIDKSTIMLETSRHSESDHQDDSTHSPRSPRKKRYCECFAAGVYCIDICNCRDCYNKPEFEETVLGTRQQIESRNPLAFMPKIIRASDTSPAQGDESKETPASARHKRGCNCKKSQCLKKYCECYQAGVGCADGCRCEGCRNIYGRNEGNGEADEKDQQGADSEMKMIMNEGCPEAEFGKTPEHRNDQSCRDLTPITPYLENTGQYRTNMELRSNQSFHSPLEPRASTIMSSHSPSRILGLLEKRESFGSVHLRSCFDAGEDKGADSQPLSARLEDQDKFYTLTPPLQSLRQLAPVLTDELNGKSDVCQPLIWRNQELSSSSRHDSCIPENTQTSFIQQMDPLGFSPGITTPENPVAFPVTPFLCNMYTPQTRYDMEEVSELQSHRPAWFADANEPTVLRELNSFAAPNIIRKTRSPQQKRVFSYQQNLKSTGGFLAGLGSRNGRKIVLHALPSSGFSETTRDNT